MSALLPPQVRADPDVSHRVIEWAVPLEINGRAYSVAGVLDWTPPPPGLGVVRGPGCVGRNRCRGRVVVALAASGCGLARPCLRWLGVACGEHSAALGGCVVSRVRPADGAGADVGGAGADVLRGTGRTAAAGCQGFGLGAVPDRDLRLVARRGGTTRSRRVAPVELSLRSVRLGGHA